MTEPKETGFADRLKAVRKSLRLKQKEFAERLKISGPALSEIESGKYKPGHDFFIKIAKEFEVNLYYLLFGEGDMFLDPMASYIRRVNTFAVNTPDVREFFHYFERSSLLQYLILAHFKLIMTKDVEREAIEKEIKD